jgi:hypothetical protein
MGGFYSGEAQESTLKELSGKIDGLNISINNLNSSTTKANDRMILLTFAIFLLTSILAIIALMPWIDSLISQPHGITSR